MFVCTLNGGGDIAYMEDVTGPGLTEGHKRACFDCVAWCPVSDSGPG